MGQRASSAINSNVLGDTQDTCRGEDGDNEEGGREKEEEEEEEDRVLQSAAFAATGDTSPSLGDTCPSLRYENTDGAPSPPPSFVSPEGTQPHPNAQPPPCSAPGKLLTPLFPGSAPLAKSQSLSGHAPVGEEKGLEGGGGTAPLRDTSRGTIRQARTDRTCGSTREGCEGAEGKASTTARDNSCEKPGRPVSLDSPRCGSSGSDFPNRPADRNEAWVSLQEASPPMSTLDGSGPPKRTPSTQQPEGNIAESATLRGTASEARPAQATVDAGSPTSARTLPGEEKGGSKNKPAGLGVALMESVDGREGVAGQTRVSSSMWSDLDGLDSDDSDERGSSVNAALEASGQPQDDEQGTGGSREAALAKHSDRSQDNNVRETDVGGRDTIAPPGVEGKRGAFAGDLSLGNTEIQVGGNLAQMPQANAAPDQHMATSSGQAGVSMGDALSQNLGGTPVAALSGTSAVAARGGVFSFLGGEGGFEDDDLLDAALDDSDQ